MHLYTRKVWVSFAFPIHYILIDTIVREQIFLLHGCVMLSILTVKNVYQHRYTDCHVSSFAGFHWTKIVIKAFIVIQSIKNCKFVIKDFIVIQTVMYLDLLHIKQIHRKNCHVASPHMHIISDTFLLYII